MRSTSTVASLAKQSGTTAASTRVLPQEGNMEAASAGPKLSEEPSQVCKGKVNGFSPNAPQEHTHRPGKLRPGVV